MDILVDLSSRLISEALCDLLRKEAGSNHINTRGDEKTPNTFKPDIILVDRNALSPKLYAQYPESKIMLVDSCLAEEDTVSILLSHKIAGVISARCGIDLLKKALEVVSKGEVWIDNATIMKLLRSGGELSKTGQLHGMTPREKEIIQCVCQGCTNKEIASRLSVGEQTVKAHLNRIYKKMNVSSRSKLMALIKDKEIDR